MSNIMSILKTLFRFACIFTLSIGTSFSACLGSQLSTKVYT
ncbi:MAG: hypothetical protein RLZZ189_252, partial [Pseudomonadota bacterium]